MQLAGEVYRLPQPASARHTEGAIDDYLRADWLWPYLASDGLGILFKHHTNIMHTGDEATAVGLLRRAVMVLQPHDFCTGGPQTLVDCGLQGKVREGHEAAVVGVVAHQDDDLAIVGEHGPALAEDAT